MELLDGDAFREIARLIDVAAELDGEAPHGLMLMKWMAL